MYSAQQRFYIRAARSDLHSTQLALADARDQAMEDTAITYTSVDHAQKLLEAVSQQHDFATRLVSIVRDRVNGKLDDELELMKARRVEIQLRLQKMRAGRRSEFASRSPRAIDRASCRRRQRLCRRASADSRAA